MWSRRALALAGVAGGVLLLASLRNESDSAVSVRFLPFALAVLCGVAKSGTA